MVHLVHKVHISANGRTIFGSVCPMCTHLLRGETRLDKVDGCTVVKSLHPLSPENIALTSNTANNSFSKPFL